jgi:hypothetical protein
MWRLHENSIIVLHGEYKCGYLLGSKVVASKSGTT